MPPDYTREGGSIGVVLTIANALGVNILLLPIGRGDDGAQYVLYTSTLRGSTRTHLLIFQLYRRED